MLRHNNVTSILRFYNSKNPSKFEDYVALCNIFWETNDTIWMFGFMGDLQRAHLRELLNFLETHKIKKVKAYRSLTRTLPMATFEGDYLSIDVDSLLERFKKIQNRHVDKNLEDN